MHCLQHAVIFGQQNIQGRYLYLYFLQFLYMQMQLLGKIGKSKYTRMGGVMLALQSFLA